jgi:DNA-binding response OmpR family regulator
MRLLVIEDDRTIASFLVKGLQEAGFAVDHAEDGRQGLALALTEPYDAAVVDLMLPELEGLALIEDLRRRKVRTPVLILSAKRSVDDRVQALIRRSTGETQPTRLAVGDLSVDLVSRRVERAGTAIELRPREFALLEYLMRNAGRVVSKTMIMEHIFNYSFDPRTNIVDVLVFRLREKIDRAFQPKLIHTVRGIGYVLKYQ